MKTNTLTTAIFVALTLVSCNSATHTLPFDDTIVESEVDCSRYEPVMIQTNMGAPVTTVHAMPVSPTVASPAPIPAPKYTPSTAVTIDGNGTTYRGAVQDNSVRGTYFPKQTTPAKTPTKYIIHDTVPGAANATGESIDDFLNSF